MMETAPLSTSRPVALVLGLGASGLAMARWLARLGWRVRVADTRAAPPQLAQLQADIPQAEFVGGSLCADLLAADVALVASSPGLSPHEKLAGNTAAIRAAAQARGIPVLGELELFARALTELATAQAYRPQVVAITDNKKKTTVTSLTGYAISPPSNQKPDTPADQSPVLEFSEGPNMEVISRPVPA